MRALIQDILRWCLGVSLTILGHGLAPIHRWRRLRYARGQAKLRRRYQIEASTPVRGYGPEVRAEIEAFIAAQPHPERIARAETSGSTSAPKILAYPPARVRAVKWAFIDAFARAYAHRPPRRHSLYVFSSLIDDRSLTGLMLEERGLPPYLACLQAPYRVHAHPEMQALAEQFGGAPVRLLVLTIANPGVLYATNPSTLAQFLTALGQDHERCRTLIRRWVEQADTFRPAVRQILRRLESRGATGRLLALTEGAGPLSLLAAAPAIEAFICWDGGYVAPFLERIRAELPGLYHLPMYSMSTETLETVPSYGAHGTAFLPLAPGVLTELLPEAGPDAPEHLLSPTAAQVGQRYRLVVSDAFGLRRYQTGDIFRVERMIGGLPDLRFERRQGLSFSFTGEKLTGDQVVEASARLGAERPDLAGSFFSLVPAQDGAELPYYRLILVPGGAAPDDLSTLAERFDLLLGEINHEYQGKRQSQRLGPLVPMVMSVETLARRIASAQPRVDWESQLKVLPLYPRLYEASADAEP